MNDDIFVIPGKSRCELGIAPFCGREKIARSFVKWRARPFKMRDAPPFSPVTYVYGYHESNVCNKCKRRLSEYTNVDIIYDKCLHSQEMDFKRSFWKKVAYLTGKIKSGIKTLGNLIIDIASAI